MALAPYALTLFDTDTRGAVDARFLAQLAWQSRIAQLVKSGLFGSEKVAANPKLNMPAGMRYALDPAYQTWLDMNDARCLKLGDTTMEVLSVNVMQQQQQRDGSDQKSASAMAKLMLRLAKDAWINKVNVALPEVEAVKDAGGVPVIARLSWNDRDKEKEWRLNYVQAPQSEPAPPRMPRAALTPALSGLPVDAVIGAMGAGGLSPNVASAAATPAGPPPAAGDVVWQGAGQNPTNGRVSSDGLTVTYCCAGASSATQASTGVSSGKVYAEFQFTARPRSLKGDTWTTIGVLPAPDARSGNLSHVMPGTPTMAFKRGDDIVHSDVIGIAIDMDAGMVYFSRNGTWLNGQPGTDGGTPLERGKQYRVTAVVSASSSSSGTDSWTANFGKTKFRNAMPRGYRSYDGKQRG